jgi:hypothetical protein
LYQARESPPKPLSNRTVGRPPPEQRKFSRRPSASLTSVPGRAAVSEFWAAPQPPALEAAMVKIASHVTSFGFAVRALVL